MILLKYFILLYSLAHVSSDVEYMSTTCREIRGRVKFYIYFIGLLLFWHFKNNIYLSKKVVIPAELRQKTFLFVCLLSLNKLACLDSSTILINIYLVKVFKQVHTESKIFKTLHCFSVTIIGKIINSY